MDLLIDNMLLQRLKVLQFTIRVSGLRTMKIDEILKRLENIKINEDELVDISLLQKIKRKEDVIAYILDTLTKTTNTFNSIIYINSGVVKYYSRSVDNHGKKKYHYKRQ